MLAGMMTFSTFLHRFWATLVWQVFAIRSDYFFILPIMEKPDFPRDKNVLPKLLQKIIDISRKQDII